MYTQSDDQLIHLLRKDNRAAFTEIYNRYSKTLAAFVNQSSKLHDLDDAMDVLHDLFVWLWEERHRLVVKGNLKNYLFTAVRYRIIDSVRKNSTRQKYADLLEQMAQNFAHTPQQHLEAKELNLLVGVALDELSPRIKEIYRLSREEHLSSKEIAEQLEISEQTVKNQLTTALKHIRNTISTVSLFFL